MSQCLGPCAAVCLHSQLARREGSERLERLRQELSKRARSLKLNVAAATSLKQSGQIRGDERWWMGEGVSERGGLSCKQNTVELRGAYQQEDTHVLQKRNDRSFILPCIILWTKDTDKPTYGELQNVRKIGHWKITPLPGARWRDIRLEFLTGFSEVEMIFGDRW